MAGEHGCGPGWPGDGLGVLDKLCWGWKGRTERHKSSEGQVVRDETAVREGTGTGERDRAGKPPGGAWASGGGGRSHLHPPEADPREGSVLMTI